MAQAQVVEPVVQQEAVVTREIVEPAATYFTQPAAVTTMAAPATIIGGSTQYVSGGYSGGYVGGTVIGGATRPIVSSYGAGATYAAAPMTYAAPAMSAFDRLDANHDGVITRA